MNSTDRINKIIDDVIGVEGGYSNDKDDPGGETNWGITVKTARANGYIGEMKDMPRSKAEAIYFSEYVVGPGFDKIIPLSAAVAAELVDTGVNMGPAVAGEYLQRSLNALSNAGLTVDGKVGQKTRDALTGFNLLRGNRGEIVMLRMLNSLQCVGYIERVEKVPSKRKYIYGWVDNRVAI